MRMMRINNKLALAASLAAVVVGLATGVAFAAAEDDTDGISPASTDFTAAQSSPIVFVVNINGMAIKITCQNSSISGRTPAAGSGLGPFNINNPTFSNCRDNSGGIVTITTNSTKGPWQQTFLDASNDEGQTEPNVGDRLQITIPKAGMTFKFQFMPGCVITAAPNGPANITGVYDDTKTLTFSNASFPLSGAGCTAGPASDSSSYNYTPTVTDTI